jgi:hypothetical protein
MGEFHRLWQQARSAFSQPRVFERAKRLAISALVCLGRHTITGLITTAGRQFVDWTADYRLFAKNRMDASRLFAVPRQAVIQTLKADDPLVVFMDDTILRKRGRKVAGASWRRDPLGPHFRPNFVWAQRFLQISAALPEGEGVSRARAIPLDFHHCPTPSRPKKTAPPEALQHYRALQNVLKISQQGVERLQRLRRSLDEEPGGASRRLIVAVDGGYTNRTTLKNLPARTTLIGRIRKDAQLYALPLASSQTGRKPSYGKRLPTPEALRQDDSIPWQKVHAFAAGEIREFQIKTIAPVRWRAAGGDQNLRLLIIRPLAYRPTQRSRWLYRDPAYLICTDSELPLDQLLQDYVWRNEIEGNFRDEKTLLGAEQPQVHTRQAVENVPPFIAASYSMLLVALHRSTESKDHLRSLDPKWRTRTRRERISTQQAISLLREQLWGLAVKEMNFSGFADSPPPSTKPEKLENSLHSAVFYAQG